MEIIMNVSERARRILGLGGADGSGALFAQEENSEKTRAAQQKTQKLIGEGIESATRQRPLFYSEGNVYNKYLNYSPILNNKNIPDIIKNRITRATGQTAMPIRSAAPRTADEKSGSEVQTAQTESSGLGSGYSQSGGETENAFSGVKGSDKIGFLSRMNESGGWNPGAVSSGKGDPGGVSYGMPQFTTRYGNADGFVNWLKQQNPEMGAYFGNSKAGSAEFTNAWKRLSNDAGDAFGNYQLDYAYSNWAAPFIDKVKKETGVDLSRSKALQEAAYSASIQYGRNATGNFAGITPNMSDKEIIDTIYSNKLKNLNSNFKSSSENVRAGVKNRIYREWQDVLKLI